MAGVHGAKCMGSFGLALGILAGTMTASAQDTPAPGGAAQAIQDANQTTRPAGSLTVAPEALAKWRNMRFGMFIHWGPVSLKGTEIGWSRGAQVPQEEYDNLCKKFNPTLFNADEWAKAAKDAGMKYMVLVTKHHDGFCMWPSKYTEHDMDDTPGKQDIVGALATACRKADIAFGTYYSTCDWYHPDFPLGSPGGSTKKPNPNMAKYVEYLRNQTSELITKYGPLCTIWFDVPQEVGPDTGLDTIRMLRGLQPDIVINNRVYGGPGPVGDYDTPEQSIGGFKRDRPWETCMTICNQWAWKPDDGMKSREQCIRTLLLVAGGDGNFLFNVGPMPDGRIEDRQVARLKEMGDWLAPRAESLYATRGGPFKPGKWGAATCKDNKIYLHVFSWPAEGALALPAITAKVLGARVLPAGDATVTQDAEGLHVTVAPGVRDPIATTVVLEVEGSAFDIPCVAPGAKRSLASGKPAKASNVYQNDMTYAADKALDGDPDTRWATDAGVSDAWLEVDLGAPTAVAGAEIIEECGARVQEFELLYQDGTEWKQCHKGTTIGQDCTTTFAAVTAQHLRLHIIKATDGPTISEFVLTPPAK